MGLYSWIFGSKKTLQKSEPKKSPPPPHQSPKPESNWEAATVKRVIPQRGIAFLTRGEGQPDIYVHKSTLKRCGLKNLQEGQKVEVKWGRTEKGIEASELRLIK